MLPTRKRPISLPYDVGRFMSSLPTSPANEVAAMEPTDQPPLDHISAAELVARTVDAIDASTEEERDCLLAELLYRVWGSIWAQNQ